MRADIYALWQEIGKEAFISYRLTPRAIAKCAFAILHIKRIAQVRIP